MALSISEIVRLRHLDQRRSVGAVAQDMAFDQDGRWAESLKLVHRIPRRSLVIITGNEYDLTAHIDRERRITILEELLRDRIPGLFGRRHHMQQDGDLLLSGVAVAPNEFDPVLGREVDRFCHSELAKK